MLTLFKPTANRQDVLFNLASRLLLLALGVVIALTFRDYGISWDEELQSQYGQAVYDYYISGFVDHRYNQIFNLYLYGGMFDGLAAFFDSFTPGNIYATRHLLNALFGLLGLWGVLKLGRALGGAMVGFVALFLLAMTPLYYGHMFNNPKDIPFAAGLIWSFYYLTKSFNAFPKMPWRVAAKAGIVIGLTLGVRVGGVMLLGYWGLSLLACALFLKKTKKDVPYSVLFWGLVKWGATVGALSYVVMLICWPWAQEAPLANPLAALGQFSNFPQIVEVLLAGQTYLSTELPWYYVPLYFAVQLPLLQLSLFTLALVQLPWILRRLRPSSSGFTLLMMGLMAAVPISYAMFSHPALYDAVRHFTFVTAIIAVFSALGVKEIFLRLKPIMGLVRERFLRRMLWGAGSFALVSLLVVQLAEMVRLHPYEYIYYNQLAGGLAGAFGQYELDYWGCSFKEASEKLQKLVDQEGGIPSGKLYQIAICGPWSAATVYLPPNFQPIEGRQPAEFFLATTRWMCQNLRQGKEIVRVERDGVPLSVIKDLRETPLPEAPKANAKENPLKAR